MKLFFDRGIPPYAAFMRMILIAYSSLGANLFFIALAVLTGIGAGLSAVFMRFVCGELEWFYHYISSSGGLIFSFILPLIGISAAVWIKHKMGSDGSSVNMTLLLNAIRRGKPEIVRLDTFSHLAAAPLTIGLGGSAGLSTPAVLTGASIGVSLGGFLKIPRHRSIQLMICGTAAGISGIFNSPVAGILFAMELLMPKTKSGEIIPVLLAASAATAVSQLTIGTGTSFFQASTQPWRYSSLPYFFLLGLLAAGIGLYMIRVNAWLVRRAKPLSLVSKFFYFACGAALIAALFPVVSGEGVNSMQALLERHYTSEFPWKTLLFGGGAVFLKIIATSLTLAAGGAGGFFSPSIFTGAFLGFTFASLLNALFGLPLFLPNFIIAGMAGVFASTFRAPLTSVFLAVEMTASYDLMIPLALTSAVSFALTVMLEKRSLYSFHPEPVIFAPEPRTAMETVGKYRSAAFVPLYRGKESEWSRQIEQSSDELFPVLTKSGMMDGVVYRKNVDKNNIPVKKPDVVFFATDNAECLKSALSRFRTPAIPVVNRNRKFIGFAKV